ncbi:MAG TPA: 16S rRNA (cytosine(967)-C(5))-methyltransferase RsmB [Gemmatimonadales bacterium]|nr:16S rRNA (cytosine(967)-C(5))-methyltransferase RsmB [Gemmatimonadales bacterium]
MVTNTQGLAARRAALEVLRDVGRGRPLDAALAETLRALPDQDRRLAHELAAGVLRGRSGLDRRLAPLVPRGLARVDPAVRDVLRLGAYQLTALDRVPPHAAVGTSVALAREAAGARAAGFVNAVLRRLGGESGHEEPTPARQRSTGLAERYSHPPWLVRRWEAQFGPEGTERLLQWNNKRPRLVLQPARATMDRMAAQLKAAGVAVEPAPHHAGLVVDASRPDRLPGYTAGDFTVQDPAQSLVARYADVPAGWVVYDACAAPGGKTIGLARGGARVLSADLHPTRLRRLRENLSRAGTGREMPLVADAANPPVRPVDAVLLDAPCLGTGSFARHPDARWRVTPAALGGLASRQTALLHAVADRVRPGGLLIYATCSLEPEENVDQVERFLRDHPDFVREPPPSFPSGLLTEAGDLMTLPQRDGMDGAYAARLRRQH